MSGSENIGRENGYAVTRSIRGMPTLTSEVRSCHVINVRGAAISTLSISLISIVLAFPFPFPFPSLYSVDFYLVWMRGWGPTDSASLLGVLIRRENS